MSSLTTCELGITYEGMAPFAARKSLRDYYEQLFVDNEVQIGRHGVGTTVADSMALFDCLDYDVVGISEHYVFLRTSAPYDPDRKLDVCVPFSAGTAVIADDPQLIANTEFFPVDILNEEFLHENSKESAVDDDYTELRNRIVGLEFLSMEGRPSSIAVGNALFALHLSRTEGILPKSANPTGDESLLLEWVFDDAVFGIDFYNSGEIVLVERRKGLRTTGSELLVGELEEKVKQISHHANLR